jgi:hypothetical protein
MTYKIELLNRETGAIAIAELQLGVKTRKLSPMAK